jgi:predicted porin
MKKHLIAAAVAAAIAVPAAAQVTVYGMIGFELNETDTQGTRSDTGVMFGSDVNSTILGTPVIGFRGSEDLGGGLKASFQLEGALNGATGAVGDDADDSNDFFSRQSWVGISGGFGDFRFGKQNNALKDIDGFGETGVNFFDLDGGVSAVASSLQNRDTRTVKYISPRMNGFAGTVSNSTNVSPLHATVGLEVTAYNATYSAGPLKLGIGQALSRQAGNPGFERSETVFGGSYNLGVAVVDFSVQNYEIAASGDESETDFVQIGAHIPLGGKLALKLNHASLEFNGTSDRDTTHNGIMAVYSLSKRTAIYAGYRAESGDDGADADIGAIGINHKF